MKFNKWTLGLAALGLVSFVSAEERSNPVLTALSTTTISGYVDTSAIWKMGNSDSRGAFGLEPNGFARQTGAFPLRAFDGNGKQDTFSLNVVGLTIEKPMGDEQWASAYKADLLFGPDADAYTGSVSSFRGNRTDLGIKQAYVALKAPVGNGLVFKLGVFDALLGAESFEGYKNPNFSRSYAFGMLPLNHTGLLASYKVAEFLSFDGGVVDSVNGGINAPVGRAGLPAGTTVSETEKAWTARATFTAPESTGFLAGSTFAVSVLDGLSGTRNLTQKDVTYLSLNSTLKTPIKGLTFGAAWDELFFKDHDATGGYAYTVGGYIGYEATEKLKLSARGEFAKGTAGTWYTIYGVQSDPSNELLGVTTTVDYSLWGPNVITRAEFRWDHELTGQHINTAGGIAPFGYNDANAFSLALNVIYKF